MMMQEVIIRSNKGHKISAPHLREKRMPWPRGPESPKKRKDFSSPATRFFSGHFAPVSEKLQSSWELSVFLSARFPPDEGRDARQRD